MIHKILAVLCVVGLCLVASPVMADSSVPYVSYDAANGLPNDTDKPHDPFSFLDWANDLQTAAGGSFVSDGRLTIDTEACGGDCGNEARFWFDIGGIPGGDALVASSLTSGWQLRVTDAQMPATPNVANMSPTFQPGDPPAAGPGQLTAMQVSLFAMDSVDYRLNFYTDDDGNPNVRVADTEAKYTAAGNRDDANNAQLVGRNDQSFTVDLIGNGDGTVNLYIDGWESQVTNYQTDFDWGGSPNQLYIADCCGGGGNGTLTLRGVDLFLGDGDGSIPGPVAQTGSNPFVPEPSTFALMILALMGFVGMARRRR